MSKFFDRMWKNKNKTKQNEEDKEPPKSIASSEDIEDLQKSKIKEKNKRLESLNSKIKQSMSLTTSFLSPRSSISKKINLKATSSIKEMNIGIIDGSNRNTRTHIISTEDNLSNTNIEHDERKSDMKSMILTNNLETMDQTSPIVQNENLNSNPFNLHNDVNITSFNVEDGCIHNEAKTFELQEWIDNQIDFDPHLCSLNVQKQPTLADKQFESYFDSKFNENHLELQAVVKSYSSNKIPYTIEKNDFLEGLKRNLKFKDVDSTSFSNKHDKFDEDKNSLKFEEESLYNVNKTYTNSNISTSEDEGDESYIYNNLSNDSSHSQDELSLQEVRSSNENHEIEQFCTRSNYNMDANCLNHKLKGISKIPFGIRDKLRFDKTLFYDSVSSVQPYFQNNSQGPISQPNLKIESARLINNQGISLCSSPEINKTKIKLKHLNFSKRIRRSRSSKEIVTYNKESNTLFDGFKQLPQETQDFLEIIVKKSSQRLSNYQQVADKVIEMTSTNLKAELETMCKLDNDLQNITESVAIPFASKAYYDSSNIENSPLKKEIKNQTSGYFGDKITPSKSAIKANDIPVEKKKKMKRKRDKILRNIQLGPDARYYRLTQEEEDLVEKILIQPDIIDNQTNDGCSVASFASTGYDFDEDDARRIAIINTELEYLQHQLHNPCSVSSQGDKEESDHCISTYENPFSSRANSTQCETNSKIPSISTKQGNSTACIRKPSHQSFNKIQYNCTSYGTPNTSAVKVKNYLEEQRIHRECQKRIEEIDKMLKELEEMEPPKLTNKEIETLLIQCKYEQELLLANKNEPSLLDSTSQMEQKFMLKDISEQDKMLEFDEIVINECNTLHLGHSVEENFYLNQYDTMSQINHEVVASA